MEKFKLGLVGCGSMMANHVKGVNDMDNVEIVAVCDLVEESAKVVSDALSNHPKVYSDYRDMVDEVDGVLVALPHDLHFSCGMFFAGKKKHVLMEKPLCNTEEECLRLIETCEENGVTLMCAYPVPFWPEMVKLKELIDSGEFGKVMQMSIWTEQLTGLNFDPGNPADWAATARIGGGQLFSHGCHYIDILLRFLGNPVCGAHVGTNVGTPWMLREGTSSVVMKFESGAIAYHGATWGARGTRLGWDCQIQTEKGLLDYDRFKGIIKFYNRNKEHIPGALEENAEYSVLYRSSKALGKKTQFEIDHFVDCIRTGKEPITSGRKSLQSLRVIWELYNAEKNGFMADLRGLGLDNA